MGIRARVAAAAGAAALVLVLLTGAVLIRTAADEQRAQQDRALVGQSVVLGRVLLAAIAAGDGGRAADRPLPDLPIEPPGTAGDELVAARLVDGDGVTLAAVGADLTHLPPPGGPGLATVVADDGSSWRARTTRPARGLGPPPGSTLLIQTAVPTSAVEEQLVRVRRRAATVGVAAVAGAALLGWVLTGPALRPLRRLQETADRVATTTDLTARLDPSEQPAELVDVAASVNAMLQRLEQASSQRESALATSRSFAADVAHELRTPLTSVAANLQLLRDHPDLSPGDRQAILADVLAEQRRLTRTLDALHALAVVELAPRPSTVVDVADLVAVSAERAGRQHPGLHVDTALPSGPAEVRGDPDGLQLALDNLLANAAVHAADDAGQVRVRVSVSTGDGAVLILVDDDGPGVPAADRQRVRQRFHRADRTRPGSGLGLAIVEGQVRRHGGELSLHDSPWGGLRVRLRLPAPGEG